MAGKLLHVSRSIMLAAGLGALIVATGCARSSEEQEEAQEPTPPSSARANEAQAATPQLSTTQAPPSELTDVPALPRRETPQPRIGSQAALPAESGEPRPAPQRADQNSTKSDAGRRPSEGRSAGPALMNPLRDHLADAAASDRPPPKDAAAAKASAAGTPPNGAPSKKTDAGRSSSTQRPRHVRRRDAPYDAVQVNGPIFESQDGRNWDRPRLAFVITGMEDGYIEPCGCAGIDRMKGGMTRRYTLFKQLREHGWPPVGPDKKPRKDGWPLIGIDVGGIAHGYGQEEVLKFQTMIEGKREMGYQAIALGASDLQLPAGELASAGGSVPDPRTGQPQPSLFISANVALFDFNAGIIDATRVIEVAGMKIGITAILGRQYQKAVRNDEVKMSDLEAALKKIVPELKRKAECLVLLAHATREESIALGKTFPEFNIVVTAEGFSIPPRTPEMIPGTRNLLIEVGHKGMDAIVLALFDTPTRHWRYQRVPLDSRFPAAPEMKLLMAGFQEQLKNIGFAGLGLRPVPHPLKATNGNFVGSKKCESCHDISYEIWKNSGHGHAYATLTELTPPRNFDPECVSCHVTGWHPTKYFPYESGYWSQTKTPGLVNTGCEDCHGPGEKHVAVELSGSEAERAKYRTAVRVTKAEAEKQLCITCHDGENSPDFDFKTYWPLVEHKEQ